MQTIPILSRFLSFLIMSFLIMALVPVMIVVPVSHANATPPQVDRVVVYKSRKIMELQKGNEVVRSYKVALGRNPKGPKQKMGDCRTPEGAYIIDRHKKDSGYYKSLHLSYPNCQDLASAKNRGCAPGGSIMIHGLPKGYEDLADIHYRRNWTKGCIAVNNKEMDEIWHLVVDGTPIIINP